MIARCYQQLFLLFLTALLMHGCIEPYEFEAESYENVLVLQANLTDELKRQEVLLSTSFMIGEEAPVPQTGADVRITDDSGNEYLFEEVTPGRYESAEEFAAKHGRSYRLIVTTPEGQYVSDDTRLQESTGIDNLYASRTTHHGIDGVALQIDNYNPADAARYYRYKFEETYKIISRFSHAYDLVYENGFIEVPKTKEETTCYNTVASNDIILASTTSLQENNLEGFLVRFIDSRNPISSRSYSILVKQYALSPEAFAYYETLKRLSGSDNIFSQNQPGFVTGNIHNVYDPEEKVVGMFNVSSVSSRRLYFDYSDFYGPEDTRPYFTDDCDIGNPDITPPPVAENLIALLELGRVKYLGKTMPANEDEGPYRVVNAECVDCTLLGTNEVPDFWVEE